jgi:hypothetical protein
MSGGSYDYLCYKIEEAARRLCSKDEPDYRRAFGAHLFKVAEAMHDVEWCDDADMSPGADEKSIMECITKRDCYDQILQEIKEVQDRLERLINSNPIG